MALQKRLLFLTLNTFSSTGGIEKVNRVAGKALYEIAAERGDAFTLYSMYDAPDQLIEAYIPATAFKAFSGARLRMIMAAVWDGRRAKTVILSHINLLPIGFAIKLLSPKTKLLLIAHGIEVWVPLPAWKRVVLKKVDRFLPVSAFTAQKLKQLFAVPGDKITVVNNCLDPFLKNNPSPDKSRAWRQKYGLASNHQVLFTLTRIKFSEQYKGYDKVIRALPEILKSNPNVKYLVAGKYDREEKARLGALTNQLGLQDKVTFTGYVTDEEAETGFQAADIYIMPSTGEGFGIVFIEALFYGLPVIAGNKDGSVDALANGKFGLLINPDSTQEIVAGLKNVLTNRQSFLPNQSLVQSAFGFKTYKGKLKGLLLQLL